MARDILKLETWKLETRIFCIEANSFSNAIKHGSKSPGRHSKSTCVVDEVGILQSSGTMGPDGINVIKRLFRVPQMGALDLLTAPKAGPRPCAWFSGLAAAGGWFLFVF